jgi:para-nitrobenzyl esterase
MSGVTVKITSGKIRGTSQDGIFAFLGLRYGESTGGNNRFMPPVPAKSWTGIRDATHFGPASWQPATSPVISHLLGYSGLDSISEDCLVLNVWTQGLNDNGLRPVMVWLHGGGFFMGSGDNTPCYNGASLARKGVVLVSVNHRLGPFGYLYLQKLSRKYQSSGNAGMLDLILALKWIQENIAVFGGNPGNVTVFGESGGGTKVSTLMAMPAARGLFHRAIIESGPGLKVRTSEEADANTRDLLKIMGVKPDELAALYAMRASEIQSASDIMAPRGGTPPGTFSPVVDGDTLPTHPFFPGASPVSADIPLMIGTNKDEETFMFINDPRFGKYDEATMRQIARDSMKQRVGAQVPLEKVDDLILVYRRLMPGATPHDLLMAIETGLIRIGSTWLAERQATLAKAPVFLYLFTLESPALGGVLKSPHTIEMPFVFNNVKPTIELLGDSPALLELADRISDTWIAFARNGDPNHVGIPYWPPYETDKRSTMLLNIECRVEEDPYKQEREAWS